MNKSPIVIGSDHAAFRLKERIKSFLTENGIVVEDKGPEDENSVDYPDYAIRVASYISAGKFTRGILLCGTGIGMSIAANRFSNVRAALCNDLFSAIMSRRHNDSNVLVMGGRVIGDVLAIEILKAWLETPFEGGRHQARLDKFNETGSKCLNK
ncbi:MAG: ribose 5-phosphate isomerase B [Desulfobacteraceae bacterium]|nr:MAG: ribose 5-phosphate isomerase B [Desulfobacteraceae bacterium]RPJ18047.1 MAG: ribose 5-phosphate isomerase B [Desulfobacteraceae bacterium]